MPEKGRKPTREEAVGAALDAVADVLFPRDEEPPAQVGDRPTTTAREVPSGGR